jgi:predicted nuclease of predicted toxin-antitoxin system
MVSKEEVMTKVESEINEVVVCYGSKDERVFIQSENVPTEKIDEILSDTKWNLQKVYEKGEEIDTKVSLIPEKQQAAYSP